MTMTSVAVGPVNFGGGIQPLNGIMLGAQSKRHPQHHQLQLTSQPQNQLNKGYETLSKASSSKKSWSVRLGLSRASSQQRSTVSGGSALAQQMIYAEPWLYGTVRGHPHPMMSPVLLVCSCPEFLHGTARDLGSNCRKCGGHRLAGLAAIGGTCRLPTTNVRSRPSLAGMLKASSDDPYDLMRRSRLLEPRCANNSPLRLQAGQQQLGPNLGKKVAVATVEPMSRTEWFTETPENNSTSKALDRLIEDNNKLLSEQKDKQDVSTIRSQPGRLVRPSKSTHRSWPDEDAPDSRKSILECEINPYRLLKTTQDSHSSSDDNLSEHEGLFDPSKVKSIERIRSVAAIGGQRIRVFSDPLSGDEIPVDTAITRIPIPKISPKRPPRRLKEARANQPRASTKSILKKPGNQDVKRTYKSVFFNVDNLILAPDKPPASVVADICISPPPPPLRKTSKLASAQPAAQPEAESAIVPEEVSQQQQQPRFITIPNIRPSYKKQQPKVPEAKIVPRMVPPPPPPPAEKQERQSPKEDAGAKSPTQNPSLTRSQSERSSTRPTTNVAFVDTMRLSFCRTRSDHQDAQDVIKLGFEEVRKRLAVKRESSSRVMSARIEEEEDFEEPEVRVPHQVRLSSCGDQQQQQQQQQHFFKMRPTSWSPPPVHKQHNLVTPRNNNVCKITVSPPREPPPPPPTNASQLVHRLQIGSSSVTGPSRGTSILINASKDSSPPKQQQQHNKVTISVGSDLRSTTVSNPTTVISINGPKVPTTNSYKSNILIGGDETPQKDHDLLLPSSPPQLKASNERTQPIDIKPKFKLVEDLSGSPESSPRFLDSPRSSSSSKEELISKLLEDSLRKARENGEILDEGSGEAILKILKQSLLKSSLREPFVQEEEEEENAYEVIKEPIYEEIPDEPPPLPLSPPPTEDFAKNRIFFADEYKDAENLSTKFELLNFIMDSKERTRNGTLEDEEEDEEEEEEEEEEQEEDPERDLEALYEQKETSLGDLSSKSSQISNVSDSSEECNIILANSTETPKSRTVEIERTDSGVGSESSQASSGRGVRWRSSPPGTSSPQKQTHLLNPHKPKNCEDCEMRIEPLIIDSVYSALVCRKCSKKRAERKEIITEIVETEVKYGRDLKIILEEFHRPMLRAGLLTQEQLSAIFLNVEELLEHNQILADKLKDAVELAQESNDEDLVGVDLGKIFLESERMLHAFESYCTRQAGASLLLQNLEKEKELLRIFLKVSQMENAVLRRMNLNSFLMVPVQRVTKYPLLLSRLLKATPSGRPDMLELKKRLKQAQTNIELHLEHMNAEAKDITSTKLWRRISIIQNGRRSTGEQDMVNIKLRKMAVEVLEWAHEDSRFVLEGRLLVAQPTDNNWRRGRTVKLAPITAMLVSNGKPNNEFVDLSDDSLFPKQIGVKEATLLLVKEKLGRYSLLREPLYLDKCIVCCETDLEDYFEIQELSSKETFIFKAEDGARTKRWCRTLQAHAQSLGAWRRRRGALPNIMICGVARN